MYPLFEAQGGRLTVEGLEQALADHAGHPTSICRHSHDGPDHSSISARGLTVASLITEPEKGLLHVARSNPCWNEYATYRVE